MAQAPTAKSAVIPFPGLQRVKRPAMALPLPGEQDTTTAEPAKAAVDLTGKRKVIFLIGRGRIGKTTLARWLHETMEQRGGSAIVAAMDPTNRSLRTFLNDVVEPPSTDPDEVREWSRALLQHVAVNKGTSAIVDLGGGNTTLSALMAEMPNLVSVMEDQGVAVVAMHVVGAHPHDLVPLAIAERERFKPAATAIVLNETHGRRHRFDEVLEHEAFQAAMARGATQLWMPRLSADAAANCEARGWSFNHAQKAADAFTASSVRDWLQRMGREFAPIESWLP